MKILNPKKIQNRRLCQMYVRLCHYCVITNEIRVITAEQYMQTIKLSPALQLY